MFRLRGRPQFRCLMRRRRWAFCFLDDLIALRALVMFSKYSPLLPVQPENPQEAWDAFRGGSLGAIGPPKCLQMDEGGGWKNELRADLRADRRFKLQFQGVGARPWLLERRNEITRRIYNRLFEDDRFPNKHPFGQRLSASGFRPVVLEYYPFGQRLFGVPDGFLASTRWTCLDGRIGMKICCLLRIPHWRVNLRSSGNFVCGRRCRP